MSMLMRSPSKGKPPLPEPVSRIPRRNLRSNVNMMPTTPVSAMKTQISTRLQDTDLRPEYKTISYEFRALEKMVEDEFGNQDLGNIGLINSFTPNPSVVYERGRFYDEYSTRRNERLSRKKGESGEKKKTAAYSLGVNVEFGKKRVEIKKVESLRKSVPTNFSACRSRTENTRYSLRSNSKENKKAETRNLDWAGICGERKIGARRVRKI